VPEQNAEDMPDRMPEDMPDRMPEDMPDKMPEGMSDRMPEDLPVTKCINVMVGITRSKVFFFDFGGGCWTTFWICQLGTLSGLKKIRYHDQRINMD
jgi:hypothetical protein